MRYLLDTNAVIALLKGGDALLARRVRRQATGQIGLPAVVMHELYYGAYKSRLRERNLAALDAIRLEVLAFDREDAQHAGEIRAWLAAGGRPIGPFDVLIAGQARSRGLILVTNNLAEFERVPGLKIEDWSV
jgi:tRNA(fMet)-specific endonuclease VapC